MRSVVAGSVRRVPTAAEYEVWAWRLGALADELTGLTGPLLRVASPEAVVGGMVAVTVDVAVRAAQANSLDAAGRLVELGEECRRRAVVCGEYAEAMALFERRTDLWRSAVGEWLEQAGAGGGVVGSAPTPPREPPRPYVWVER